MEEGREMSNAFITGGAGFVGSHLSDYLLANTDWNIHILLRWQDSLDNIRHLIPRINNKDPANPDRYTISFSGSVFCRQGSYVEAEKIRNQQNIQNEATAVLARNVSLWVAIGTMGILVLELLKFVLPMISAWYHQCCSN